MANDPRKTPPQQRPPSPPAAHGRQPQPSQREQREEPPKRVDEVRALVKRRMMPSIRSLLPKNADVERWVRVFLTAMEGNADLMRCTDASIARAMLHAAEVQLQPGGAYPHCYLIPYFNRDAGAYEVQCQISVWGYTELVRRAGVKKVWADVVRENDDFKCISGSAGKQIVHNPNWFATEEERGQIIGAYACAMLENDEVVCEPASIEEIQQARAQNKGKSPAWDLWFEQQAMKVCLKRLSKYLPKGGQPERALELDEDPAARSIIDTPGVEVPMPPTATPQGALDQAVAAASAEKAQAANDPRDATIDRGRLRTMLVTLDERWGKPPHAARIDSWDEMQALQAMAYLHAVMRDGGAGIVPDEPPFLKIEDAADVIR